ncbi:hypothetical protein ES707_07803 [subsurface metagenome]
MNREIKFRVWHTESKRMFYQSELDDLVIELRRNHQDCPRVALVLTLDRGPCLAIWKAGSLISTDKFELMQYTGLKDKNGKEIYEGDIVKVNDSEWGLYKVVWFPHWAGFFREVIKASDYEPMGDKHQPLSANQMIEVIGNVWENPELLKE